MMVPSLSVACCVWISFVLLNQYSVQGLKVPFTETPTNPTYVVLGSVARLKWNFLIHGRFRVAEIQYKRGGTFKTLAGKGQDGTVQTNPNEPDSITKRITIEGNATLVISGVKAEDFTEYKCVLVYLNAITVEEGVTQLLTGLKVPFTEAPTNLTYVALGSVARLKWNFLIHGRFRRAEIQCKRGGTFKTLAVKEEDGTIQTNPLEPDSITKRITIEGNATLVISGVKAEDITEYKCVLVYLNTSTVQGGVTQLILTVAPTITVNASMTINENQDLTIKCTSSGTPTPNVTWVQILSNGGKIIKSEGKGSATLFEPKIKRPGGSTGKYMYECQARNIPNRTAVTKQTEVIVQYGASITRVSFSPNSSWIGQTVELTCEADGVPEPTITLFWPNGTKISKEKKSVSKANVALNGKGDFGNYKCEVDNGNGFTPHAVNINLTQINKPGPPTITLSDKDIQATSLTVRWNPPIEDGGSSVTRYRVIVWLRETDVVVGNVLQKDFGELKISTNYTLEVSAINLAGEGRPATKDITTKFEGVPEAAELSIINTSDPQVFELQWTKPKENGWPITNYTIYKKLIVENGDEDDWVKVETVKEDKRAYTITLEAGKQFKIVVTASNNLGEAKKEENRVKTITVPERTHTAAATVATKAKTFRSKSCSCEKVHIAYGVVIAVLGLIIVAQLILICWSKRGNQKHASLKCEARSGKEIHLDPISSSNDLDSGIINPSNDFPNTAAHSSASPGEYMPLVPRIRSWELKRSNINVEKIIGKGTFSKVGKATATGIRGIDIELTVAVKMLKENAPNSDRKDLLAELELMKTFKPHPHVIKLLGCVTESEPPMVIIEYVPYGDLLGYLRKSRGLNDTYYKNPDVKPRTNLTSQQLMSFAWQIADGMNFLASKKVIHRDLAARNVLVGEGEKCKVTDFGMARDVHQDDIYTKRSRGRLPVKWTAYESLLYGVYTTQSDVWSYGVVLYEIFTIGGRPYPNMDGRRIAARLQEGYRMPKPAHLEDRLYCIMTDCWKENPSERPTFSELKDIMAKMERNHRTYINLKEYDSSLYANVDDIV